MTQIVFAARCKPWSDESAAKHELMVDSMDKHPRIRVWDPIGRIYTVCHSLTPASQRRLVKKAFALAAAQ